ncbi:MAG: ligase-associated DNA damage response endonuclease PdeM [Flavobacteriales bacterium]|nr:ligase-associated DNA damage response endonuclease PdeM [Flavobacteriales bacterium]
MYELLVQGLKFYLLPQKALFIPFINAIVVSDVHLGKAAHFRKNGIQLTEAPQQKDLQNIQYLINAFNPTRFLFLGDLFHSSYNEAWQPLNLLIAGNPNVEFILIKGNHDILSDALYAKSGIKVRHSMQIGTTILFSHEPVHNSEELFNIYGHLHPAISLTGKGKQKIILPCFWKGKNHLVMPCFGTTTGTCKIKPKPGDEVFAITPKSVISLY